MGSTPNDLRGAVASITSQHQRALMKIRALIAARAFTKSMVLQKEYINLEFDAFLDGN